MTTLDGKRAVVTGGASGIGAACARALANAGARVVIADRDEGAARDLATELGGEPWVVDLSRTDQLESVELTADRSEEHTSELQSRGHLVCRLLLEKKTPTTRS